MAFKKNSDVQTRPNRRWVLFGAPSSGKSSFAAQMRAPIVVVDADRRFNEVKDLANGTVLTLSDDADEQKDVAAIDRLLREKIPGSGVRTIVVDSVNSILVGVHREEPRSTLSGSKSAVRWGPSGVIDLLGAAVTGYGTDALFVWNHTGRNWDKQLSSSRSLPETVRSNIRRFVSAELHLVVDDKGRRGVKIEWSRFGSGEGVTIYDTEANVDAGTFWKGIPERVEALIYPAFVLKGEDAITATSSA